MHWYSVFDSYFSWFQTRRDGSLMTLAQSKKLSQMTADNAQWEDRQLLRSGAVKGTEVQTEFDDEDERKVILLVHGMFFACLFLLFEILDSVSFLITHCTCWQSSLCFSCKVSMNLNIFCENHYVGDGA